MTKNGKDKLIIGSTTRRYLLAVLIIAVLSSSAYYTLQSALSDSEATAYIVNLSGRQRMLSQRIALDAHRSQVNHQENRSLSEYSFVQLMKSSDDMRLANKQLSSGVLEDGRVVDLSPTIRDMYFGEMDLYDRVNHYLEIAGKLQYSSDAEALAYLDQIDKQSEQLLIDLNRVVKQYQIEGERRLGEIERLELLVWISTMIVLLLEIIFIFRPMARSITLFKRAYEQALEKLEEMVELRTLKLQLANQKLEELASLDPLTQLKNRLSLENDIEEMIEATAGNQIGFALCMLDIDWFKRINDTYGHAAGDFVLQEFATLLKRGTREYDHIYRAGGEEFVLILNRVDDEESQKIIEKLRKQTEQHVFNFDGTTIRITLSAGLYHSSHFNLPRMQLIMRSADRALYSAKTSGRNCVKAVTQQDVDALEI